MLLVKYDKLPDFMKNEKVKEYYDILQKKQISLFFKRIIDIALAFIILVILFPIILLLAICIKLDSKGPVFFKQERITMYGKKFKIYKFRTMVQNADKNGSLITVSNDIRITKIGKLIRKTRLDELPQLFNVITGNMSFVGTRPEVKKYVDRYSDEMKATLLMPAGITSNASIKFKDEDEIIDQYSKKLKEKIYISSSHMQQENTFVQSIANIDNIYVEQVLTKKMKYNLEYIQNFNLLNDFKIMMKTIFTILK